MTWDVERPHAEGALAALADGGGEGLEDEVLVAHRRSRGAAGNSPSRGELHVGEALETGSSDAT